MFTKFYYVGLKVRIRRSFEKKVQFQEAKVVEVCYDNLKVSWSAPDGTIMCKERFKSFRKDFYLKIRIFFIKS